MFYPRMESTKQDNESYLLECMAHRRTDYLYTQLDWADQRTEIQISWSRPDAPGPDEARPPDCGTYGVTLLQPLPAGFYPLLLPIAEPELAERVVEVAIRLYGHCGVAVACASGTLRQSHQGVIARIGRLCHSLGVPLVVMGYAPRRAAGPDRCGDAQPRW